jgi:hypothetical protein
MLDPARRRNVGGHDNRDASLPDSVGHYLSAIETRGWPRFFVRHLMRLPRLFGISVFYRRLIIENKLAFARSMEALLQLDCDRLIVAHWKPIETQAKRVLEQAIAEYRNR